MFITLSGVEKVCRLMLLLKLIHFLNSARSDSVTNQPCLTTLYGIKKAKLKFIRFAFLVVIKINLIDMVRSAQIPES
jgi:hypothetical protein